MGESGFTSISHELVFEQLAREIEEKKKLKNNTQILRVVAINMLVLICGVGCAVMGWAEKVEAQVANSKLNRMVSFGHCFKITLQGLRKLNELEVEKVVTL